MSDASFIWLGSGFAAVGIGLLRVSWGRSGRSAALNFAAWGLLVLAAILAGAGAGAWGVAVAANTAMAAAGGLLLFAAWQPGSRRRGVERILRDPRDENTGAKASIRRAFTTFLIAGPLCLIAAVAVSMAVRALIMATGGAEADGNVAVLGIVPLIWPILAFALMVMRKRSHQLVWLGAIAAASTLILITQGIAA